MNARKSTKKTMSYEKMVLQNDEKFWSQTSGEKKSKANPVTGRGALYDVKDSTLSRQSAHRWQ
jgi:hypothetical protein